MSFYSSFFLPEFLLIFVEHFAFVWINVFLPFASPSLHDCSSTINIFFFFCGAMDSFSGKGIL